MNSAPKEHEKSSSSPMDSSPYIGLFNEGGGTTTAGNSGIREGMSTNEGSEEQEIVIWDRLPKSDYVDMEMPSKVTISSVKKKRFCFVTSVNFILLCALV
jgi:hypothetical protein